MVEIEAIAAPDGSVCAKHPQMAGLFVCPRCGDYGCEHCVRRRGDAALCQGCAEAPRGLPELWSERLRFLYLSFDGRVGRKTWWLYFYLPSAAIQVALLSLSFVIDTESFGMTIVGSLFGLVLLVPGLAICVKRLHDRNVSGFWMLLSLVPLIGPFWFLVALGLLKGDVVVNRYGAPPV